MGLAAAGLRIIIREDDATVSPAQEKVLVALTVLAFTEAFRLLMHGLLPVIVRSLLAP